MMKTVVRFKTHALILLILITSTTIMATEAMKGDNVHVRVWNKFASDSLALHNKLTSNKNYQIKTSVGSYANVKDFYVEHQYLDEGKLVSQVQWERIIQKHCTP